MKRNNAGMSLVELVVVIAMISILLGSGIYGVSQVLGFRARDGADSIANSLSHSRVAMLGKAKKSGDIAWQIERKGNEFYVSTIYNAGGAEVERDRKKIVDGNVKVLYNLNAGKGTSISQVVTTELAADGVVRLYFNRSTGARCTETGSDNANNVVFRVKNGKKEYDVVVIAKTGKIISESVK